MEQADSKQCPKSEAGEGHDTHSWIDKDGLHSCDASSLSTIEALYMLGLRRIPEGSLPLYDTMDEKHILSKTESLKLLFGDSKNSLEDRTVTHREIFPEEFGPVDEMTGPSYSPNDPLFQVANIQKLLSDQTDVSIDGFMGPKTEFGLRTYGWSEKQLREALYKKEQEVIELKILISKMGTKIERTIQKMFGKVDKINAR